MAIDSDVDVESAPGPSDEALTRVADLTSLLLERKEQLERAEAALKDAQAALKQVEEVDLPRALLDVGLIEYKTTDGARVELKTSYHASIPKERQGEAFAWLDDNGYGAMIKHDVTVQFGRADGNRAARCFDLLREEFPDNKVVDREHVAPQTLSAFVKEQMADGRDVPLDLLGVFTRRYASVKLAKKKGSDL